MELILLAPFDWEVLFAMLVGSKGVIDLAAL